MDQLKDRKNLTVLTGAVVTSVISSNNASNTLVATEVEFVYEDQTYTVHIGKEAIISAGYFLRRIDQLVVITLNAE